MSYAHRVSDNIKPRKGLYFSLNTTMKWYLIWFFTVTLPNGNAFDTSESRMMMFSEEACHAAIQIKQTEQEQLLGAARYVYSRSFNTTGGYGIITSISVGCVQR